MLSIIQSDWYIIVHWVALFVLVCVGLNVVLPPALTATDTWTSTNPAINLINKTRQTKAYGWFRQCVSLGALAIIWAKNYTDPSQREALEKLIGPALALLATLGSSGSDAGDTVSHAADLITGADHHTDAGVVTTPTPPITQTVAAATTAAVVAAPAVTFTLSGPVIQGLDNLTTITPKQ